jgi:hypothetical protein
MRGRDRKRDVKGRASVPGGAALGTALSLWKSFDPRPPVSEIAAALREHPAAIVEDIIRATGSAGRLGQYRGTFARFVKLRVRSRLQFLHLDMEAAN